MNFPNKHATPTRFEGVGRSLYLVILIKVLISVYHQDPATRRRDRDRTLVKKVTVVEKKESKLFQNKEKTSR